MADVQEVDCIAHEGGCKNVLQKEQARDHQIVPQLLNKVKRALAVHLRLHKQRQSRNARDWQYHSVYQQKNVVSIHLVQMVVRVLLELQNHRNEVQTYRYEDHVEEHQYHWGYLV